MEKYQIETIHNFDKVIENIYNIDFIFALSNDWE